jgi:hypothetical protein
LKVFIPIISCVLVWRKNILPADTGPLSVCNPLPSKAAKEKDEG